MKLVPLANVVHPEQMVHLVKSVSLDLLDYLVVKGIAVLLVLLARPDHQVFRVTLVAVVKPEAQVYLEPKENEDHLVSLVDKDPLDLRVHLVLLEKSDLQVDLVQLVHKVHLVKKEVPDLTVNLVQLDVMVSPAPLVKLDNKDLQACPVIQVMAENKEELVKKDERVPKVNMVLLEQWENKV